MDRPDIRFAFWLADLVSKSDDQLHGVVMNFDEATTGWDREFIVRTAHHRFHVAVTLLPHEEAVADQRVEDGVSVSAGGEVDQVEVVGDVVDDGPDAT